MFEKDTIQTNAGDLEITFIGHGTLMLMFNEKIFHVDPWSQFTDYANMPSADIILITHEHHDHLDPKAIEDVRTENTTLIYPYHFGQTDTSQLKELLKDESEIEIRIRKLA